MGRGMVRSAILLVLIWNLAVRASPTTYTMLPLGLLMASPDSYVGRRILTTGIYQVRTQSTYAVDGWLEERQSLIRIVGPIFDWQPVAGIRIDAWGVFRRDGASGELFLDYFNGRRAGDHLRNPRLTSILSLGRTVWLAGRLRQTGSEPIGDASALPRSMRATPLQSTPTRARSTIFIARSPRRTSTRFSRSWSMSPIPRLRSAGAGWNARP